jgi:hypothetical protein
MARCLASYIADPERIRREVNVAFGSSPCIQTIYRMRENHLRGRSASREPFHPHDGYYPGDALEAADRANALFLDRLRSAYPERFPG